MNGGYRTTSISSNNRIFRLKHQIRCSLIQKDNEWLLQYDPLEIRTYGTTPDQAIHNFSEHFNMLWDEYALEDDSELDSGAQGLKRNILDLVEKIEE